MSRVWNESAPALVWLLLNPSTADESRDDPTIRRCIGYSMNWGYGGAVIHNLFAWRSTYPDELNSMWCQDPVGADNDAAIAADAKRGNPVVCGWGNKVITLKLGSRLESISRLVDPLDLFCLKLTALKQPQHPLYLHSRLTMQPFAMISPAAEAAAAVSRSQ